MKIRMGFITNSSSTNFLIISKDELTEDLLFKKLGFIENGKLSRFGHILCNDILYGIDWRTSLDSKTSSFKIIKEQFGDKAARKYDMMNDSYVYIGSTDSDDNSITAFFTMDSFEIEDEDFYMNGRECAW